jgi:glycosyltransferase involved in cell wall biosynthesis
VPSIYQPWDLQHLHLPEFFTPQAIEEREISYRAFCTQATMVAAASKWSQCDLIRHYELSEDKVRIVAPAAVLSAYPVPTREDIEAARTKFSLPDVFVFYPAQTWPHKNHLGLIEAIAQMRDGLGIRVCLVSSGRLNDFYPEIQKQISERGLMAQVQFLGFVTPLELQCLYQLCRCMVFPSKFEGFGMPILEAFLARVPVACSNVTSLPELAGDAALLFDPYCLAEITEALKRLWTDDVLCRTLIERGQLRVRDFDWAHSARRFRAHYRRIANRALSTEDQALLGEETTA